MSKTEEMKKHMEEDVRNMVMEMLSTHQPSLPQGKVAMFADMAGQLAGMEWGVETHMRSTDNGMVYISVSLDTEVDGIASKVELSNTGVSVHVDCMSAYSCYESIECMEIRYGYHLWVEKGRGEYFHVDLPKSKKEETA